MAACGDLGYMKARPASFQRARRTGPNFLGRPCLITHGPQEGLSEAILVKMVREDWLSPAPGSLLLGCRSPCSEQLIKGKSLLLSRHC